MVETCSFIRVKFVDGFGAREAGEEEVSVRRAEALPQFVEVRSSGLARQRVALPCAEQAALALRFAPEDHEELTRRGRSGLGSGRGRGS